MASNKLRNFLVFLGFVWTLNAVALQQIDFNFIGLCKNAFNISIGLTTGEKQSGCLLPLYSDHCETFNIVQKRPNLLEKYSTKDLVVILTDKKWFKHSYKDLGVENVQFNDNNQKLKLDVTTQRQKQEDHGLHLATKYMVNLAKEMVETGKFTLTEEHLFGIHQRVLGNVFRNYAGIYRRILLWYRGKDPYEYSHQIPFPYEIERLMARFFTWYNGPASQGLHPIDKAVMAYLNLMFIHPFVDGNGRTGRLLMNLILLTNNYSPLGIPSSDRVAHYRYSKLAMYDGNPKPFTEFILKSMGRMYRYLMETRLLPANEQ